VSTASRGGVLSTFGSINRCAVLACLVVTLLPFRVAAQSSGTSMPKLGDSKVNLIDGAKYLWIPPGIFTTGCSSRDEECYEDEYPPRR
jgi:hypothetical protein